MRAVTFERFGGPEVLRMSEVGDPVAGRGELVVRIRAAAVNPLDWKIRSGTMNFLAGRKFPKRTGIDFCGVIEACGPDVVGLKPGDEILGETNPFNPARGTFAEKCVARAEWVLRKPERLSNAEAAAAPVAGLSALQALRHCGVGPGKRILLIGASGGLGTFAIQIAKAHGAHVTAVCSTHGVELSRKLGADVVIDRSRENPLAGNGIYDAVLDLAAVHTFADCRHLLTPAGIYLHTMPGAGTLWSQYWTRLFSAQKAKVLIMKPTGGDLKELGTLMADGSVTPIVSRTFPFNEESVREMHRISEEGHVVGKLVAEIPAV